MTKDIDWGIFFRDEERFADFINGSIGLEGGDRITADDVLVCDSKVPVLGRTIKQRDVVRRIVRGINFVVIDIEAQETVDYSYPLRDMGYVYGEYEDQARSIKNRNRRLSLFSRGGYMYRFNREDKLKPAIVILLYSGVEEWDGPRSIYDMLDMTEIPEGMQELVQNHRVNLVDVHRLTDEALELYGEELWAVLSSIRYGEDKVRLRELFNSASIFKNMSEDAANVMCHYIKDSRLAERLKNRGIVNDDGGVDMCKGIEGIYNDGVECGIEQGIELGREQGIEQGIEQGREQGMDLVNKLAMFMEKDGRIDEFLNSLQNADIQRQYLKEYGLI